MSGPDPVEFGWWLASRAAGIVALLCIAVSVGIGLAMAGRLRPRAARTLLGIHQQTALVGLVAIAVHAITLLGDRFMSPSIGDITLPFTSTYEPLWTGLGVTGGWLAAILGLSYWIRHRIGPALWRKLHRATVLVYVLAVAHTLGAGTDASEPWMLVLLVATGAPILFLLLMRILTPAAPAAFRRFRVVARQAESSTVTSLQLAPADRRPAATHEAGQFVTVAVEVGAGERLLRSYSLSSTPRADGCRISVKREPGGRVSGHLHGALQVGDVVELTPPDGRFVLGDLGDRAVVLISAGIGVTPVLAMLETLAQHPAERELWWIHGARDGSEHAFADEVRAHLARMSKAHSHVRYSRPAPGDRAGRDYDAGGRLSAADIHALGVPRDSEFRLCGPTAFVAEISAGLIASGVAEQRIRSESFGGPRQPAAAAIGRPVGGGARAAVGGEAAPGCAVHAARAGHGPAVCFERSGVTTCWDASFASLLDLAEANAVAAPSGCRIGSCHGCAASILSGTVRHDPEPLLPPARGSALLCCAQPVGDVVIDA